MNFGENPPAVNASFVLEQQLISDLIATRHRTEFWEKRKKEHVELRKNLEFFAKKMKHRVFAPLGKKAMIKADLIHTNEITVSLGADWFVKVSALDAVEICQRRIDECDEKLKICRSEKHLLESRKDSKLRSEAFGGHEIVEKFDETEEEKWRKEHREKMKQHKKRLSEVKEKITETYNKTDEDLWKYLDMMELKEELEDELARMEANGEEFEEEEEEEDDNDDDDDDDMDEEEIDSGELFEEEKIVPDERLRKRVSWVQGLGSEPVTEVIEAPLYPEEKSAEDIVQTAAVKEEITETKPATAANITKPSRPPSKFKKTRKGAEIMD